jgi:hypothetical protein
MACAVAVAAIACMQLSQRYHNQSIEECELYWHGTRLHSTPLELGKGSMQRRPTTALHAASDCFRRYRPWTTKEDPKSPRLEQRFILYFLCTAWVACRSNCATLWPSFAHRPRVVAPSHFSTCGACDVHACSPRTDPSRSSPK